ncbi:MAG: hypothetical protein ACYC6Y_23270 [Thermoguttaceae bacterium]
MSNRLPHWIERLLGIETSPGEGAGWSIDHSWGWPAWTTLLLVLFVVAVVAVNYARENPEASRRFRTLLALNRIALLGIVLFMLARFVLLLHLTGLPFVAIVLDDSLSMTTADQPDDRTLAKITRRVEQAGMKEPTRFNQARALLCERDAAMLRSLREDRKLRLYYTSGISPSQAAEPDPLAREVLARRAEGKSTRLGATIRAVFDDLRGMPPAAIVLLTDGVNTEGPSLEEATDSAVRKGVPLFAVGLGDQRPVRDLQLTDLLVEDLVFVGDVVQFEFRVGGAGYEGKRVDVVLRQADRPDELARTTITVPPAGQTEAFRIPYRPAKEGEFRFVVEIAPQEGEQQTENNRRERLVRVRKEKIRVLLACGYPSYEFRYLRNMFKRDETIELDTVLQEADLEYAEQDATALRGFPVRREEVFKYDVILLGDVDPGLLSPAMLQNVADFVNQPGKGGALVCIAGPRHMPLAYQGTVLEDLLPVRISTVRVPLEQPSLAEPIRLEPTEMGLASPGMQLGDSPAESGEIWGRLPGVYWCVEAADLKPGARVLATRSGAVGADGAPLPAIVMQYVGAGKVLFHATDETWRWRYRVGDIFYSRYWVQTVRYLCRSKLSESAAGADLMTDRREYQQGEPVVLRVRFDDPRRAPAADDGVTVVVEQEGRQLQRVKLQRGAAGQALFQGTVPGLAVGDYHAWLAVPTLEGAAPAVDFSVAAPPGEFEHIEMDAAGLRQAAERTGGRFYTWDTAGRLLGELPRGRQVPIESLPPIPLWNRWFVILAFLTLLVTEWILRKIGHML